jgi:hypothetical protein
VIAGERLDQTHLIETTSRWSPSRWRPCNGGAAVALVTYLGNLVSHGSGGSLPDLSGAVVLYSAGLPMTVLAFAYTTQLRLYVEERDRFHG